jgi:hypothetical protein
MNKFVEVFIGSRGCLEEVKVIESEMNISDYYECYVESLIEECYENGEDDIEYYKEFIGVEEFEGFKVVGLNEEENLVVFDFEENKEVCNKLLKLWKNGDEVEIRNVIDNLNYLN